MTNASSDSIDIATGSVYTPVKSELLCFVANKSSVLALDDIVKICADFYREDEIISARRVLDHLGLGQRLPKRKGADKLRHTVQDIAMVVLNPEKVLPVFYATDLARLPPVDVSHCDISAILIELQALRSEVREMKRLQVEVNELRQLVYGVSSVSIGKESALDMLRGTGDINNVKPTDIDNTAAGADDGNMKFSVLANQLKNSNINGTQKKKAPIKPVVGTSITNRVIKSVKTFRTVNIFVSRLHPSTVANELVDSVNSVKGDLEVQDVKSEKLNSRFESLYSSYHVIITVCASDLKRAIELFMCAASWPEGVFVRRYFKPAVKNDQQ